jgi:hypothetical protein
MLALLFLPVRTFLRKRLIPLPSPNLPPSGAAPWSRAPVNAQGQSGQPFPFAQPGNGPFNAPTGAPFPGGFNAAPTQANVPANTWNNAMPASSYPQSTPALAPAPAFPGYANQAQPLQPFPTPPVIPTTNGYAGLTQNQQPFPTTSPLLPGVQAAYASKQPAQAAGSVPPGELSENANQPDDSSNNLARKRLRRNGLRPAGENRMFSEQTSSEHSADRMVVSDPYLQALLRQNSQQEQIVTQAPEESL